jgi:translation initiation factor 2 beta subunit (eIF-2beta)/eIF-5
MSIPDYVVCLDCETPCYTFEWTKEKISEVLCQACGNDQPEQFALPEELEDLAQSWHLSH